MQFHPEKSHIHGQILLRNYISLTMQTARIIPALLLRGEGLYKTTKFTKHSYVGDPINALKIFNEKEVDEIMVLDIDASKINNPPQFY